jgi:hypothetical protein
MSMMNMLSKNQVKSLIYGFMNLWIKESRMMLMLTAANTSKEIPVIATPRAVPAAGGCSMSMTTMMNMAAPTANEHTTVEYIKAGCGIKENKNPQRRPTS